MATVDRSCISMIELLVSLVKTSWWEIEAIPAGVPGHSPHRNILRRVVHGVSCPWGEMTVGRVVTGRVWMGRVVRGVGFYGASCPETPAGAPRPPT